MPTNREFSCYFNKKGALWAIPKLTDLIIDNHQSYVGDVRIEANH